jgi:hypothetical protein
LTWRPTAHLTKNRHRIDVDLIGRPQE